MNEKCSFFLLLFVGLCCFYMVKSTPAFSAGECCSKGQEAGSMAFKTGEGWNGLSDGGKSICTMNSARGMCSRIYYRCCRSALRIQACIWSRENLLSAVNVKSNKFCIERYPVDEDPIESIMQECCTCCMNALAGIELEEHAWDALCYKSAEVCSQHRNLITSTIETELNTTTAANEAAAEDNEIDGLKVDFIENNNATEYNATLTSLDDVVIENNIEEDQQPETVYFDKKWEEEFTKTSLTSNDGGVTTTTTSRRSPPTWISVLNVTEMVLQTESVSIVSPILTTTTTTIITTTANIPTTTTTATSSATSILVIKCSDEDYEWNPEKQICERVLISCPTGFYFDKKQRICRQPDRPLKPCERGYRLDYDAWECKDIDECVENPNKCEDSRKKCVNTDGGFSCTCTSGYRLASDNSCKDIDECEVYQPPPCPPGKKCYNTQGAYECRREMPCGFGYTLDSETQECIDIDECKSNSNVCGPGMECINVRGGHKCAEKRCPEGLWRNSNGGCSICREGYQFNNATQKCEDIDECEIPRFAKMCRAFEKCVNRPGTFDCKLKKICNKGTRLASDGNSCDDIDECYERHFDCADDQICFNEYGSYQCKPTPCMPSQIYDYIYKRCSCKPGFRLNEYDGCQDINECERNPCGSDKQCINLVGSYGCYAKTACPVGMYSHGLYSRCVDLDECTNGEATCPKTMDCVNTVGSYTCVCRRGFKKLNSQCVDIDECKVYQQEETCPDARATCVNSIGSYLCSCPRGFTWLDHPIRKCEDLDECNQDPKICGVGHKCINLVGSYRCQCGRGYAVASDGKTCQDVDECSLRPRGRRTCPNGRCFNFPGGYHCQCPPGYRLGSGNRCEDIDECRESLSACTVASDGRARKDCINLKGSYKCVLNTCPHGYAKSYLGNGMKCELHTAWHCNVNDIQCHKERPYWVTHQYVELGTDVVTPYTLARIDHSHLPPGNKRMSLVTKYAVNKITNKTIKTDWHFQMDLTQTEGSVDIRLMIQITEPAEMVLELSLEVYHGGLFIGKSTAFLNIYITEYPQEYEQDSVPSSPVRMVVN